ncbi:hypothetical protein CRE_22985 [Caenorhabditis remanei]|uniref:ribonuclease H n=1 Tax=Caenorhabditis remanei TaxID=31234 RepID=E3MW81_CAERE|nr:hypothetical protein CRE_22985 [Caenorhabditis remanei]
MLKQIFDLPIAIAKYLYSMLCCTTANDDKSHCIVYTDGSCINQGKDSAKAGFGVCWDENYHPNNYSGKVHGLQDSGHAELCAAEHAIKQAVDGEYRSITLRADSELVGHVVRNPEAFSKSSHPDYYNVISSISLVKSQINIKVEYVKAHNGIPGNEKADELAKLGARTASLETVSLLIIFSRSVCLSVCRRL